MTEPALQISNLCKTYGNGFEALKNLDLTVEQGDFYALLGPNGAGKSTTIGIISSLVNKSAGEVRIFGINTDDDFAQAKTHLGVVPQEVNFNVFESPWNIVRNQAGFFGLETKIANERAEQYLTQLGLWDKRNERSRNLSGGMKRRLMIARALVHQPRLLILDEPTAGVDIEIRRSMWEFLRTINDNGTTIILTTHYLEEAETLCRRIGIIDQGELIANTTMKSLLSELTSETFVLDLDQDLTDVPFSLGVPSRLTDGHTLEVDIGQSQSLNQVFTMLTEQNIKVVSLRNKSNRLEQLFLNLVTEQGEQRPGQTHDDQTDSKPPESTAHTSSPAATNQPGTVQSDSSRPNQNGAA